MTTVATEDQEQPNPSHEREARILDVTPGCRTSSGPAETRSAPKGRTYDRSRPSRAKRQIVLAIRGRPHMRWRSPLSCHIFGDRGLTHIDAELEEFAMDPRRTPKWVGEAHIPDQLTDFEQDLRSAYPRARLPSPEQAKPGPVPADNRLRLDDRQGVQNVGRDPIEARKNEPVEIAENNPLWRFSLQHIELVAQR